MIAGLAVGLEDVELSGWPCSLEVCLVELGGGRDVELAVVLDVLDDVEMPSSWGSVYSLVSSSMWGSM